MQNESYSTFKCYGCYITTPSQKGGAYILCQIKFYLLRNYLYYIPLCFIQRVRLKFSAHIITILCVTCVPIYRNVEGGLYTHTYTYISICVYRVKLKMEIWLISGKSRACEWTRLWGTWKENFDVTRLFKFLLSEIIGFVVRQLKYTSNGW